jgi:hypothetical protein
MIIIIISFRMYLNRHFLLYKLKRSPFHVMCIYYVCVLCVRKGSDDGDDHALRHIHKHNAHANGGDEDELAQLQDMAVNEETEEA